MPETPMSEDAITSQAMSAEFPDLTRYGLRLTRKVDRKPGMPTVVVYQVSGEGCRQRAEQIRALGFRFDETRGIWTLYGRLTAAKVRAVFPGASAAMTAGEAADRAIFRLHLAIAFLAGIVAVFVLATSASKVNSAVNELSEVQQTVHNMYSGQPDYTGLTSTVVANSGQMGTQFIVGTPPAATGLTDPFGSAVTVVTDTNNPANYDVTVAGMDNTQCQKLAVQNFGQSTISTTINAGTASPQGTVVDPATAQTDCVAGAGANTITWVFQ